MMRTTSFASVSQLMLPPNFFPLAQSLSSGLSSPTNSTKVEEVPRSLASPMLATPTQPVFLITMELAPTQMRMLLRPKLQIFSWMRSRVMMVRPKKQTIHQSMKKALAPSMPTPSLAAKLSFPFQRSTVTQASSANTLQPSASDSTLTMKQPTLSP